jgi:predicted ArsR family transcriptional regulator
MIQETRRLILDILKEHGDSTVDQIVDALHARTDKRVTAATIRHHLDVLSENGLVEAPKVKRRNTPGRPQYVYHLTDKALDLFPSNYAGLAHVLMDQIKAQLPNNQVNVILEGAAQQLAANAMIPNVPLDERLDYVVTYLTKQGYQASWENAENEDGYILSTSNCPFEKIVGTHDDICQLDMQLVSNLLGIVPRRLGRIAMGESSCDYFIPNSSQLDSKYARE